MTVQRSRLFGTNVGRHGQRRTLLVPCRRRKLLHEVRAEGNVGVHHGRLSPVEAMVMTMMMMTLMLLLLCRASGTALHMLCDPPNSSKKNSNLN